MNPSVIDILIRPDVFFREMISRKEDLKFPLLIVLAGSLVAGAYGYLVGGLSARMMGSAMPGIETVILLSSIIGAVIGTFLFWLIWSGVIYLLTMAFRGTGSFRRVLEVVGYGYLPQLFGSLITLIVAIQYIPRITVPTITSAGLQDPAVVQEAIQAFMRDPAMMELTQISSLITIVFLLWSANIWIFGIKHARALSMRDAAICTGLPVVAYIVYMTYNLGVM